MGGAGPVRQSTELAIGVAFRVLQTLLGADWRPRRVCFAHDAPADRIACTSGCSAACVEFGHDFNGIVCARRDLEVANPNADPLMARYAQGSSSRTGGQAHGHERPGARAGRCAPRHGTVHDRRRAQHLGVNRRTVHRHLAQEGQTFSRIVDAVRRELAARYLAEQHRRLAEVSSLLGFSAPSGFSRWYRRHFSGSPSQPRRRAPRRSP